MLVVFPFLVCSNNAQNGRVGILDFVHKIPRFCFKILWNKRDKKCWMLRIKSLFVNNVCIKSNNATFESVKLLKYDKRGRDLRTFKKKRWSSQFSPFGLLISYLKKRWQECECESAKDGKFFVQIYCDKIYDGNTDLLIIFLAILSYLPFAASLTILTSLVF